MRTVQIGNIAGLVGFKRELPTHPESVSMSNTAFVGKIHDKFNTNSQKEIAPKIHIGRKEYHNEVMKPPNNKDDVADFEKCEVTIEEPLTKRLCITFDVDSDSGYRNYPSYFHVVYSVHTKQDFVFRNNFKFTRTR